MAERAAPDHGPKAALTAAFAFSSFLAPLGTDGFIPSMVALAAAFETDVGRIQFALAAFFFGGAIGQAVIGPLADRFGRRPTILVATALYSMSALLAVWAGDVVVLIALRFLQGAGGAGGRVVTRAIVRDLYSRETGAKVLSYMTVIGTSIPIFSPMISAQLLLHFGWQAVFLFMAGVSAAILALLWLYVEESLTAKDMHAIKPAIVLLNFAAIARNRVFLIYGALAIGPSIGLAAFLAGSAAVLIGTRNLDPRTYAYLFALVMVSNAVAAFANARLVVRLGFSAMLFLGTVFSSLGGAIELALAMAGFESVWAVIAPMMVYMLGMALVMAPAQAGALVPFPDRAGAASSLIGIVQGLSTTTVAAIVGILPRGSAVGMASITALAGLALLAIYLLAARGLSDPDK